VSLRRTLDVLGTTVERATSMPLSSSCLVNRAEMLSLVERARAELPAELDEATALLVANQDLVAAAEHEAEQIRGRARAEAEALVEESVLVATARARSEQILDAARTEAARLLREADDYTERRLAGLEHDLTKAIGQVQRGRERLRDRSNLPERELELRDYEPAPPPEMPEEAEHRVVDLTRMEREVFDHAHAGLGVGPNVL
jgi:cell division septum initiation protein DivIVA